MKKIVEEGKLLIDGRPFATVDCQITRKTKIDRFVIVKGKITFRDPNHAEACTRIKGSLIELVLFSDGVIPIKLLETPSFHKCTVRIASRGEGGITDEK